MSFLSNVPCNLIAGTLIENRKRAKDGEEKEEVIEVLEGDMSEYVCGITM